MPRSWTAFATHLLYAMASALVSLKPVGSCIRVCAECAQRVERCGLEKGEQTDFRNLRRGRVAKLHIWC